MNLLLIITFALLSIVILIAVVKLLRVRVWIGMYDKRQSKMVRFGMMDYKKDHTTPTVRLIGQSRESFIGRTQIDENEEGNAYVQVISSHVDDDSATSNYRVCGYIAQDGFIYQQLDKRGKATKIGYTAQPSKPNVPTIVGERNWKSLWLKCRLNAYLGEPEKATKNERPIATASYRTIRSTSHDPMPPGARSAAFGLFFNKFNKYNYQEYYSTPYYGWKDTALLSSVVYAVIFSIAYLLWVKVLQNHLVGLHYFRTIPLFLLYFVIWYIVRKIKVNSIDNGQSIQPQIDIFNKSLGINGFDWAIIICSVVTLAFTWSYYRFDFVPLSLVVIMGVVTNKLSRNSSKRWAIQNPFVEEETDESQQKLANPEGDIAKTYTWQLDSYENHNVTGDLTLYFDSQYINDLRYVNPFYGQRKDKPTRVLILDMFHYVREHRSINARLRYVAGEIVKIAQKNNLLDQDRVQFALDFVQEPNIRFVLNRDSKPIHQYVDYIRYPDEVLFDKEADSNSKAFLAAMLFHYLGHNVIFLYSRTQQHGAIGIEVEDSWMRDNVIFGKELDEVSFLHNGKRYLFCETTIDGFRIGGTMMGMRFEDFDEKVELPHHVDIIEDDGEETVTCIYNWDLDPRFEKKLHGQYTIEFSKQDIEELREENPFRGYAERGGSYEENIRYIFKYLSDDDNRTAHILDIAQYIRQTTQDAQLDEIGTIQFTLDFCQEPNIRYCVDEKSMGIGYEKEYMRFPDEVLFDKEGDCDCKSSLATALFHQLGYNMIVMLSQKLGHAAIGIEWKEDWKNALHIENSETVIRKYNGKKYLYCETTGDGYKMGQIVENTSIQDFETIVEINA